MFRSTRQFSIARPRLDVAKLTLVGRIGASLEPQTAASGTTYLRYPIAVRTGKDETSWFNVSVFDKPAIDFMSKYLVPGNVVYIEADASFKSYEDKEGNTQKSLNLIQSSISPVGWKSKKEGESDA